MNYGGPHRIFCPHPSSLSHQLSCLEAKFPSSAHCLAYIFFSSLTSLSEIHSSILWFCSFFWVFVLHFSLLLRRGSPLDPLFFTLYSLLLLSTPSSLSSPRDREVNRRIRFLPEVSKFLSPVFGVFSSSLHSVVFYVSWVSSPVFP